MWEPRLSIGLPNSSSPTYLGEAPVDFDFSALASNSANGQQGFDLDMRATKVAPSSPVYHNDVFIDGPAWSQIEDSDSLWVLPTEADIFMM